MSVATLLTQPKLVEKLNDFSSDDTFGEDLAALLRRIALDTQSSQAILTIFENAFRQFANDFVNQAPNFQQGMNDLAGLVSPFLSAVREFGTSEQLRGNFGEAVAYIAEQFTALMEVFVNLGINDIRALVERLLTILTRQFGFSLEGILNLLWQLMDRIITDLKYVTAETPATEKELRLATASALSRVKREFQNNVVMPTISNDDLATHIMGMLRDFGLEGWVKSANELGQAIKATFQAGAAIGDIAQVIEGASVGAAARASESSDTYCWYASWLLQSWKRDFGETIGNYFILNPMDEVWVTADKTQVVLRTVFGDDVVLAEGTNLNWHDAPIFSAVSEAEYVLFPHISHQTLEFLAHFTWLLAEFGKCIWNAVDAAGEDGDRATSITHALWNMFNTAFGGLGQKPFISYLVASSGWGQGHRGWLNAIFPILGTTIPSIEGRHTEADKAKFAFWAILFADDVLEVAGHHILLHTVRDLLLSTLTLINNIDQAQGSDERHPINKEYTSTWAGLGGMIATIIFFKTLFPKALYKYPFNNFLWSFAGALSGLTGGLLGTLIGNALSAGFSVKSFFTDLGVETGRGFALFYLNLYNWVENDTDDGKFNGENAAYAGYPEKSNSPYKLPYAAAETKMCVQGNQGMWSHFASSNQIYAVDFGFDQAEEIHAARGGTVVGFHDQVPNDTHDQGWNYIVIRHDDTAESNAVKQKHDKYHDGNSYVTYGVYGHGRTNGVTEVFAARGVAAGSIVGQTVAQGDVIMKAGNTGESFHNHLHMHVKTNMEAIGAPMPATPITASALTSDTIPFVFHDIGGDGVAKSLTFYTSLNGA